MEDLVSPIKIFEGAVEYLINELGCWWFLDKVWILFLCGRVYVVVAEKCSLIVFLAGVRCNRMISRLLHTFVVCKKEKERKGFSMAC